MKTQGEIEAAICEGISRFEQEYMGRGPKDIHASTGNDQVEVTWSPAFPAATAFTGDARNSGRAYLTAAGKARSNAFTLVDSIGPVLRKAVLAPGRFPGAADTLTLDFSEAVALAPGSSNPLLIKREADLDAGSLEWIKTLSSQGPPSRYTSRRIFTDGSGFQSALSPSI